MHSNQEWYLKALVHRFFVLSIFTLTPVLTCGPAGAGILPDAVYQETVQVCDVSTNTCQNDNGSTGGVTNSIGGIASGGAGGAPLSVSAFGSAGGSIEAGGGGTVSYFFEWMGPAALAGSIPVDVDVVLQTGDPNTSVQAHAYYVIVPNAGDTGPVNPLGFGGMGAAVECTFGGFCTSNFNGTVHFGLTPNHVYEATLDAAAGAGAPILNNPNENGSASADPFMYLDPSYSNIDGYVLVLSDGISNDVAGSGSGTGTDVPEPSSLFVFSAALMGLGWCSVRKQERGSVRLSPRNFSPTTNVRSWRKADIGLNGDSDRI
jgi:hypothetical protein